MTAARSSFLLSLMLIVPLYGSALGQRRLPEPQLPSRCEPGEARTRLEEFEAKAQTVVIKGSTRVAILNISSGSARVEALELRDTGDATRATGVAITLKDSTRQSNAESRSYIDYEEIDPLIKGLDSVARSDETITKLTSFEARYRTRGDFEITVFRQTSGGIAATLSSGTFDRVAISLSLDELGKLRWMILQAKVRLDETN
jgi:hypothetical protein